MVTENEKPRGRSRRAAIFVFGSLALLVTIAAFLVRAAFEEPVLLPPEGALVRIPPGFSLQQTAARLEEAGVLRSRWLLLVLARWHAGERAVHAGEYVFHGALRPRDVFEQLQTPSLGERRVTIPEGRTAREVFGLLEAAGFGGTDVFTCAAQTPEWLLREDLPATGIEGYLFPDTYTFGAEATPEQILATMVTRYREKTAPLRPEREAAGLTEEEMVTLASLIEKEAANAAERPLIAAVFLNRLRQGMPLQSDPTVVYERATPSARSITHSDVLTPSDYNTYQHPGLPPGPIANPGLASLQAAVRPAAVDFLYFVSRNDGTHEFSRTLDEHNRAVQRFQRTRRDT